MWLERSSAGSWSSRHALQARYLLTEKCDCSLPAASLVHSGKRQPRLHTEREGRRTQTSESFFAVQGIRRMVLHGFTSDADTLVPVPAVSQVCGTPHAARCVNSASASAGHLQTALYKLGRTQQKQASAAVHPTLQAWPQVAPAALQATQHLMALQRQSTGPRSLLSAMLDRGIVKLLKLLQELLAVHPWCGPLGPCSFAAQCQDLVQALISFLLSCALRSVSRCCKLCPSDLPPCTASPEAYAHSSQAATTCLARGRSMLKAGLVVPVLELYCGVLETRGPQQSEDSLCSAMLTRLHCVQVDAEGRPGGACPGAVLRSAGDKGPPAERGQPAQRDAGGARGCEERLPARHVQPAARQPGRAAGGPASVRKRFCDLVAASLCPSM